MSDLVIKAVETDAEFVAARTLAVDVFSRDEEMRQRRLREIPKIRTVPGFSFDWYRVGVLDGEVICNVVAWPFSLRYGSVELPFGGIGAVCTHPDHRGQGYASAVMRNAIDYMIQRGDLLSLLVTGVDGFYSALGYHNVWPYYALSFPAADAAALEHSGKSRPAQSADMAQMAALFERSWGHRVTTIRTDDLWHMRLNILPPKHLRVVEDRDGHIAGYIGGSSNGSDAEVVVAGPEAARTLLAEIGKLHLEAGLERVEWTVAPDDPILFYARRWLWCKLVTAYDPRAGWMGCIVDPAGFRDRVLAEMLAVSRLDERGLIFDVQPETVYLGLRGQDTTNVQLDHGQFLQVMFGSLPPQALDLHPDAAQFLATLFPPRVATIARMDWF